MLYLLVLSVFYFGNRLAVHLAARLGLAQWLRSWVRPPTTSGLGDPSLIPSHLSLPAIGYDPSRNHCTGLKTSSFDSPATQLHDGTTLAAKFRLLLVRAKFSGSSTFPPAYQVFPHQDKPEQNPAKATLPV